MGVGKSLNGREKNSGEEKIRPNFYPRPFRLFPTPTKARFRRRTSHEPNRMLMRENKGFFSFAFDSAHVKYGV